MDAGRWLDITQRLQNTTDAGSPYFGSGDGLNRFLLGAFGDQRRQVAVDLQTFRTTPLGMELAGDDILVLQGRTELHVAVARGRQHHRRIGRLDDVAGDEVHRLAVGDAIEERAGPAVGADAVDAVPADLRHLELPIAVHGI